MSPIAKCGFWCDRRLPRGVNPHFAVVRFDVADFRGVERDFAAVGDETDRTGVGTAAFEVFFESYFRSDEGRQDQQDEGRVEQQPRHSAFAGARSTTAWPSISERYSMPRIASAR